MLDIEAMKYEITHGGGGVVEELRPGIERPVVLIQLDGK